LPFFWYGATQVKSQAPAAVQVVELFGTCVQGVQEVEP
jgi:hypothetical protein